MWINLIFRVPTSPPPPSFPFSRRRIHRTDPFDRYSRRLSSSFEVSPISNFFPEPDFIPRSDFFFLLAIPFLSLLLGGCSF